MSAFFQILVASWLQVGSYGASYIYIQGRKEKDQEENGTVLKKFFYWNTVDFQCCFSFWCIAKLISYTYTCIHGLFNFLLIFFIFGCPGSLLVHEGFLWLQ